MAYISELLRKHVHMVNIHIYKRFGKDLNISNAHQISHNY